jgi:hypothetical protein
VPRFYLERFARDGLVTVKRRDGRTFDASSRNVAVEAGFYDVTDDEGGKSSEVEGTLARLDGAAHAALEVVDRTGRPPDPKSATRESLAQFIAVQMTRTTQHREGTLFPKRVTDWAADSQVTRDLVEEYLRTQHLGHAPDDREVEGAFVYVSEHLKDMSILTPEFAIEMMLRSADVMVERVLALHWTVEADPRRQFITADVPVIPWRKVSDRDHFEGLGVDNTAELRFPLDPGKQLVLSRRLRRPSIEVHALRVKRANAAMAGACHRFIVGNPRNRGEIEALHLDSWRPVIRFNVGPLWMPGRDGSMEEQAGDVIHMWTPRAAGFGSPRRLRRHPSGSGHR